MLRITKDTLRQFNAAAGKLDTDSGQVFVGFVGRLEMSDGLYHGDLHYADVGDEPPKDTISIQAIGPPKPKPPPRPSAKSAKKPARTIDTMEE